MFVVKSAQMCKVSSDLKTGAALKAVQRCTSRLLRKGVVSTVFNVIMGSVMEPYLISTVTKTIGTSNKFNRLPLCSLKIE